MRDQGCSTSLRIVAQETPPPTANRAAQLLSVAALPVAVGLGGTDYTDPATLTDAYRTATMICAGLFALGGAASWITIRNDVLRR